MEHFLCQYIIFQNLTEFNTAHNRRITTITELSENQVNPLKRKRKSVVVHFNEEEEIINPGGLWTVSFQKLSP